MAEGAALDEVAQAAELVVEVHETTVGKLQAHSQEEVEILMADVCHLMRWGVCGGLWWFVVVCGGLRWFVMVCGGL